MPAQVAPSSRSRALATVVAIGVAVLALVAVMIGGATSGGRVLLEDADSLA